MMSGTRELRRSGQSSFEGQPKNKHLRTDCTNSYLGEFLYGAASNEGSHLIIDPSPIKNHLRVVACSLCPVCQVVGVNSDTVTIDQPWLKWQEIPLGARSFQHFSCVDSQPIKN